MPADLKASTYLVDGDDLQVPGVELLHDGAGLWTAPAEDIGVATTAGRDGGVVAGGVFPPFTLSTLFELRGTDARAVWAGVVALRRRCKPGRTITLARRMPDPDGSDANIDVTTTARRQTDRPEWIERNNRLQLDIDWLITGGPWLGEPVDIPGVGTVTVKGDLPTRHITATLSAGAVDPVVTNTSDGNGYTFRYVGVVPAGGVVVDLLARKATGTGGDLSSALKWSKGDPFQLDPGPQTLTISDGTASFTYSPAYA